jgi:hypothetical protein
MKVLILRSVFFDDEITPQIVKELVGAFENTGHKVMVYNMPSCDSVEHWAAFAIIDYTRISDVLIAIDFPVALIKHQHKRIILTRALPDIDILKTAISEAFRESVDFCTTDQKNEDIPMFTSVSKFISEDNLCE